MGLKSILDKIISKHDKREIVQNEKAMNLRKKLWDDYLSHRNEFKTEKNYITAWCKMRNCAITYDDIKYDDSTVLKLLSQFKSIEGVIDTQKKVGCHQKINYESCLCLLATVMDFPHLTDKERTEYLNTYGPNKNDNVCEKIVNNELNKLDFHLKNPAFSPKEHNTFGYIIARYLLANVLSDTMQNKK